MRICDLPENKIVVGLRLRSLINPNHLGTIIEIDTSDPGEPYSWIKWDHKDQAYSGFFWNDCECEVVEG